MINVRSLQQASKKTGIQCKIVWHSYMINTNVPLEGENMSQHIFTKFGSDAVNRYFRPGNPLEMAAKKLEVNFNLNRKMVSSLNAHRLVSWCQSAFPQLCERLIDGIFCSYFVEGKDISSIPVLIRTAESVGLDPRDAYYMLTSVAFQQDVLDKDAFAKFNLRVSGVPFCTINYHNKRRPFNFAGAQPVESMSNILQEAAQTV